MGRNRWLMKFARAVMMDARREGLLKTQPCEVCGHTKHVVGHHEDYAKPLDVVWLCRKHHQQRHSAINLELYGKKRPLIWQSEQPWHHANLPPYASRATATQAGAT